MTFRIRQTTVLGISLLVAMVPYAVESQTVRAHRVAIVPFPTAEGLQYLRTFRTTMRELGYVEGINLVLDVRLVDREMARVPAIVDEAIRLKPDVLVGWESVAQVMRAKTASIPIVLTGGMDPVGAGLAQSLRRPGLNATGVIQLHEVLPAKHIEIMREIFPQLRRVGALIDTTASACSLVESHSRQAARGVGAIITSYYVSTRTDIERAFAQMQNETPDVLLPCPSAMLFNFRDVLFANVLRLRIPLTSFVPANVPDGVLFAYGASFHDTSRRAAMYVDKILKGAKPSDLPIEQPTKFELVINGKTARALNLTIPPSLLLRADHFIE